MKTRYRRRRALAALVVVAALAVLAGLVWLILLLARGAVGGPDMRGLENVRAVVLGADWSGYFAEAHTTEEQKAFLESTLDEAAALGANTVLLTGRVDEDPAQVLFRVKGKDLPVATAEAVSDNDRLFSKFRTIPAGCYLVSRALIPAAENRFELAHPDFPYAIRIGRKCSKSRNRSVTNTVFR